MSGAPIPVEGWVSTCASYQASIRRAVVAYIRDHGPVDREVAVSAIIRAGIGGDVKKASPAFDQLDGAIRILNFAVDDIDVLTITDDGRYAVARDVRQFHSACTDSTVDVPSETDLIAERDQARRKQQLRYWLRNRVFRNEWAKEIRPWTDADVLAMALSMRERGGYFGQPIVRDQDGVIIDGHLRHRALELLDIDPARYTVTRVFDGDLDRLTWIINAHHRPADKVPYPPTLREAIVKMVNHNKPRGAGPKATGWAPLSWPDEIPLMLGDDRRDLGDDTFDEPEPEAPEPEAEAPETPVAPAEEVAPAPPAVSKMSKMQRVVARVLERHGAKTYDETAAILKEETGKKYNPAQSISPRYTELRAAGWAEYATTTIGDPLKRMGQIVHTLTAAGRAVLNEPLRPSLSNNTPGQDFKLGERWAAAQRVVNAGRAGSRVSRDELRGTADADYVLRRTMWFTHDGKCWVLLPDTLAEDWSSASAGLLSSNEEATLREAYERSVDKQRPADLYDAYEALWRTHME